jgi:hypothetical protein
MIDPSGAEYSSLGDLLHLRKPGIASGTKLAAQKTLHGLASRHSAHAATSLLVTDSASKSLFYPCLRHPARAVGDALAIKFDQTSCSCQKWT